jgi:putative ABC transport system substrate-binding protein
MKRRAVLALAGGATLGMPRSAWAQTDRVRRIGVLSPFVDKMSTFLADFREGLREYGYVEGRNVRIDYRSAEGEVDRLQALARELIGGGIEILVTSSAPAVQAARQATDRIPIVMARVGDAVDQGIVASVARPGSNVTGASWRAPELSAKALELLHDAVPGASHVAVLREATAGASSVGAVRLAARRLGLRVGILQVRDLDELKDAFVAIRAIRAQALEVLEGVLFINNAEFIARQAVASRLPSIFFDPKFVEAGGLMSYGPNFPGMHRRAAYFVDRILRGMQPGDLPVEQPTKLDLVINLKAAQGLGITLPPFVVLRADRVIE